LDKLRRELMVSPFPRSIIQNRVEIDLWAVTERRRESLRDYRSLVVEDLLNVHTYVQC
jgi:hypothetical protein